MNRKDEFFKFKTFELADSNFSGFGYAEVEQLQVVCEVHAVNGKNFFL